MALFQRKPQTLSNTPMYSIGAFKSVLIVGLGNHEKKFDGTRHNIGFAALDEFAVKNDFPAWVIKKDLKCAVSALAMGETRVILCKPLTFMNNSGEAAQAIQHFYRVYNQHTLAVYDELAIPFGQLRTRLGGSDAGHNGVKSLIQHIGEDFGRLRLGIGSPAAQKADSADFVLAKFSKEERADLPPILKEAGVLITEYVFGAELVPETRTVL